MPGLPDWAALARLHESAFPEGPRAWSAAEIAALAGAPSGLLLTDDPGAPSGFALLRVVADEAEVLTVAVDPACRRRGIARRLLRDGLSAARQRGARRAFLEVACGNAAARGLYAGLGFDVVGLRRGYFDGDPPQDALVLAATL